MKIQPPVRTALFSVLALATAACVTVYVNKLSELDPFSGLRRGADAMNPIDIQFRDVDMKHWVNGKLITSGHIGRVDVHRDRQEYELYNVTNGVYHTSDASFRYEGGHALWYTVAQRMQADQGVRVRGKEFDLTAPSFVYTAPTHLMQVPGPATGALDGGKVKVVGVVYNTSDDSYQTGPVDWQGKLAINYQNPEKSGPPSQGGQPDDQDAVRVWYIHGEGVTKHPTNTKAEFTNMRATDKVSIVTSPHGTYDRKTEILDCDGPVKYWGERANMICDHLVIYHKEKRAVATGNVVMYLKPEDKQVLDDKMEVPPFRPMVPDEVSKSRPPAPMVSDQHSKDLDDQLRQTDNLKKYPTTIRGDKIVYWYKKGERHAVCTGSPQAQQELPEGRWRMGWAEEADYDGEKEFLTLLSAKGQKDARMKNSIGDDAKATKFVMSTKDGVEEYQAWDEDVIYPSEDTEANEGARKAGADKSKEANKNTPPPPPPNKQPPTLSGPIGHL